MSKARQQNPIYQFLDAAHGLLTSALYKTEKNKKKQDDISRD